MKIGFCMFLWTTEVTEKHRPLLKDIKATGYDGVEIPIFGHAGRLRTPRRDARRDRPGTDSGRCDGRPFHNPISPKAGERKTALKHMQWAIDCTQALGARTLSGPLHSTLGLFLGRRPDQGGVQAVRRFPARRRRPRRSARRDDRARSAETGSNAISSTPLMRSAPMLTRSDIRRSARCTTRSMPTSKSRIRSAPSRATSGTSSTSTFPRTIVASPAGATFPGRRPSRRSAKATTTAG